MIYIYQKKHTSIPMEILLQDQEPQIIENKRKRGHKSLLKEIAGPIVCGMVFFSTDNVFDLDGCVNLVHLIQKWDVIINLD